MSPSGCQASPPWSEQVQAWPLLKDVAGGSEPDSKVNTNQTTIPWPPSWLAEKAQLLSSPLAVPLKALCLGATEAPECGSRVV